MTFNVDFVDGRPVAWALTEDGAEPVENEAYRPTLYAGIRDGNRAPLHDLEETLREDPKVDRVTWEQWFTRLGSDTRENVLRIDLERVDEITTLAREIRTLHELGTYAPGRFQLYNVDFSPQFRYCLETGSDPTPTRQLRLLDLSLPEKAVADRDVTALELDGEPVAGGAADVLASVEARIAAADPDVLLVSTSDIVPVLYGVAEELGLDAFQLGRVPGWQQLAGESTFESYGQIGYSAARYNVPGRAVINKANSFMLGHAGLHGLLDLVERSWKPVQEAGWASIGNLLTAIQIRMALDRGILVPWNKADPEQFKSVATHHAADRGGFTFEPEVGIHEEVYSLDFSSLYPNIMIEYNVSPETVRCDCHQRQDVPELGYSICDEPGFIPDVLKPIVGDRDRLKAALKETSDPNERRRLEQRSDALKWVLVCCFGYQGYKNSKFGRIEAHEAINAYARDILLQTKEMFETSGWKIVHGIVDSIWVAPVEGEQQEPLDELAREISERVKIRLEFEHEFDWICFVPMRDSDAGALTKYFGKVAGEDEYKIRGIELRQRSTPAFIAEAQRSYLDVLDRHRTAEAVCDRLKRDLHRLQSGAVPQEELVIRKRCSKPLEAYTQGTHTVSALHRYREQGMEKSPGQDVRYIVVDDSARLKNRVRLHFEEAEGYDAAFYAKELVRACESNVSPLGWNRTDIRKQLRGAKDTKIQHYG